MLKQNILQPLVVIDVAPEDEVAHGSGHRAGARGVKLRVPKLSSVLCHMVRIAAIRFASQSRALRFSQGFCGMGKLWVNTKSMGFAASCAMTGGASTVTS